MAETQSLNINDYRGLRRFTVAKLLTDTAEALTYETPVRFAGASECGQETNESSANTFYDNQVANTITSEGEDKYKIISSVLDNMIRALIEGREYDEETGIYSGTPLERPFMAFGFIGKLSDGTEEAVWVYKGKFTGGNPTHQTENDGTDTTNLEFEFNSIYPTNKCNKEGTKSMKFIKIPLGKTISEDEVFSKVFTWKDYQKQLSRKISK